MRISLIGMSGSGKSYWSSMLAESGFKRYCCDDLIAEKLSSELKRRDGKVLTLGEWMGFPFEPGYVEREAAYLAREKAVLSEVLGRLEEDGRAGGRENVVVDTTGSVIYTGGVLLKRLKALTIVAHFTSPPSARDEMLREYAASPRPVLWRGLFSMKTGESEGEALARCYEVLLESRERLYRELADVAIEYDARRDPGFGIPDFLALVESKR
ncbi:MAG: hypothetical protein WAW37_11840 [Syntrophobacteraceae bacterium]